MLAIIYTLETITQVSFNPELVYLTLYPQSILFHMP